MEMKSLRNPQILSAECGDLDYPTPSLELFPLNNRLILRPEFQTLYRRFALHFGGIRFTRDSAVRLVPHRSL